MKRRHHFLRVSAALLGFALWQSPAIAQTGVHKETGFSVNRYNPSERGSEWFALDSLDLRGQFRWAAGGVVDWAYRPLVIYEKDGSVAEPLITNQAFLHIGTSVVFLDRFRLALSLPVAFYQSGESGTIDAYSFQAPNQSAMGDIRVSGDVRLFGTYGGALTGALGVSVFIPTGAPNLYTGDGEVRVLPRLSLAGEKGMFAYAANFGFDYRGVNEDFGGNGNGSEVRFGAAAGVKLLDKKLLLGPEFFGGAVVTSTDVPKTTPPMELLLGAHYTASEVRVGLAAGPGLTRGLGEPTARFLLSVEWVPGLPVASTTEPPCPDRDNDRVCDDKDKCPDVFGDQADGCKGPCPDQDKDGICDSVDACTLVPGVANADPLKNGCPPVCTGDKDDDGICDELDACPTVPGFENADARKNGCPWVLDPDVLFRFDKSDIDPTPNSEQVLQEVLRLIGLHPEYVLFHVSAHTDAVGSDEYNLALSKRRAISVVDWLVSHGIKKERLMSEGYGEMRPVAPNDTDDGRRLNRRVELHVEKIDPTLRPPKLPKEGIIEGTNKNGAK